MTSLRLNFEKLKKLDELKEQTMSYLEKNNDECLGQLLMRINQYLAEGKLTNDAVFSLDEFHRFKTNHVITMANYNGRNFYMDQTNNCILRKAIVDNHLILEDGFYAYIPNTGLLQKEKYRLQRVNRYDAQEFLDGEDITISEEQLMRSKIEKIYGNNLDILEAFYQENAELYNDISNNLTRIKRKMIL